MTEGDPLHMLLWFSFLLPLIAFIVGAPLLLRMLGRPNSPEEPPDADIAPDAEEEETPPGAT